MSLRKTFLCMVILIFGGSSFALPVWNDMGTMSPPGTPPEVSVANATTDTTTLRIIVPGFWEEDVPTTFGLMKRLRLPESQGADPETQMGCYMPTDEPGKSALPVVRVIIGVTSDASTATLDGITPISQEFFPSGYKIYPYQPLSPECEDWPFVIDEDHYLETEAYPFDYIAAPPLEFSVEWWHHMPVAVMECHPFYVTPGAESMTVLTDFNVTVKHVQSGSTTPEIDACTHHWDLVYSDQIVNYDSFIKNLLPPVVTYPKQKYRIYVDEDLESASRLSDLIWWKKRQGYDVTVRTVGSTGDVSASPGAIKNDIQSFYDNYKCWDVYVLLAGDKGKLPPATFSYYFSNYAYSDYKLACVKGSDIYADLFIGRLPANNDDQLNDMIDKVLFYEQNPPTGDWVESAMVVAHQQKYPKKYTQAKSNIENYAYAAGGPSFWHRWGGESGVFNLTIENDVETSHPGIINYRGHGQKDCWVTWNLVNQDFSSANVGNLETGEYTPVVFSISCHNNNFASANNIGEKWIAQYDGNYQGAVAHLGATNASWTVPNHEYDFRLFTEIFNRGACKIAMASNYAHVHTLRKFRSSNSKYKGYSEDNARLYCVLGDPSMMIRTKATKSFQSVNAPNPVDPGIQNYTVTAQDSDGPVEDAVVTIEKPAESSSPEFIKSAYTNSSGEVTFTINPSTSGQVFCTITKHNYNVWQGNPVSSSSVRDWKKIGR